MHRAIAKSLFGIVITLLLSIQTWATDIITSAPQSANDQRYIYSEKLLALILNRTKDEYGDAKLLKHHSPTSRERSFRLLKSGKIHVAAEAPKPNWENELIPVRIPLRKGIQGYRLFMVHQDYEQAFAQAQQLADLQTWPTGSGYQWSTRRVMEESGFDVVVSKNYTSLFTMLNAKRFISFGRGINEIFSEYDKFQTKLPNVIIDQSIAVYIPLPTYFFVSPKRPALADRIRKGLEAMINDGEFDKFFNTHHHEMITQAGLKNRRIFNLNNSNLSQASLDILTVDQYWYRP
ncbi:MAG: transporter substrate-binding domain-containing protein [Cellvibrionaceae bacterium]|nr:transporter substrate-binding domain-containing protein [Cellvibrionaceae bacterium]